MCSSLSRFQMAPLSEPLLSIPSLDYVMMCLHYPNAISTPIPVPIPIEIDNIIMYTTVSTGPTLIPISISIEIDNIIMYTTVSTGPTLIPISISIRIQWQLYPIWHRYQIMGVTVGMSPSRVFVHFIGISRGIEVGRCKHTVTWYGVLTLARTETGVGTRK